MTASGAQKIKVLSIPDHNGPDRHIRLLCKALESHGVDIVSLTSSTALSLKIDVIQLHFPAHYVVERSLLYSLVRSAFMLLFFPLAKYVGGCKIVYMVHDPIPFRPRRGWLLWPMLNFVHRIVDGFIFLSDVSRDDFLRRFPDHGHKPFARIDHSALPVPIESSSRLRHQETRALSPNAALVVGYLGMIKDYKGLDYLPAIPDTLADGTAVRVIVAGKVDPTFASHADPILAGLGPHFERIDRRLSDVEMAEMTASTDVIFLPYTRGWNSGAAMFTLSCYTPILSSRQMQFLEIEKDPGVPWVHTFEGSPETSAAAIGAALLEVKRTSVDAEAMTRLDRFLDDHTLDSTGAKIVAFYRSLLTPRPASA